MSEDYKARIQKAMENHHRKLLPKKKRAPKTNPELEFQSKLIDHMIAKGFDPIVVDSSTYGVWHQRKVSETGVSDIVANYDAISCWVECKAPGRLSGLSYAQYKFLKRKILAGCFAVVVDSVKRFDDLWDLYHNRSASPETMIAMIPMNAEIRKSIEEEESPLCLE